MSVQSLFAHATFISSFNVSSLTILNSTRIYGILHVSSNSILNSNWTFISSLNVSGITTLSRYTSVFGILNVSSTSSSIFNNNETFSSSLNISGKTIIGNDIYNYSDSSFDVNKILMI